MQATFAGTHRSFVRDRERPIDADKVKTDPRLPFGLPGVNKKEKVSNGNYVWISYFYSYLNEQGRAGFVEQPPGLAREVGEGLEALSETRGREVGGAVGQGGPTEADVDVRMQGR